MSLNSTIAYRSYDDIYGIYSNKALDVGFDEKINIGGPDVNVKCQAKEDEIKMSDTFLQRQVRRANVSFLQLEFPFVLYIDPKTNRPFLTKKSFAVPSNSSIFCLLFIFLLLLEMCKR